MILDFLTPVPDSITKGYALEHRNLMGRHISVVHGELPELEGVKLAILGVEEDRRALNNEGAAHGANAVRQALYQLHSGRWNFEMIDLGNIIAGETVEDTYFAMQEVLSFLMKKGIIPIVIGGGQDLTFAQYRAFETMEHLVNLITVDRALNIGDPEYPIDSESFLNKIILQRPNILFNYSNVAYQSYFVDPYELDLMEKMHFDAYRLGEIKTNIAYAEPMVRDADMLSFDISAVQSAFAPGCGNSGPNGLTGEEACAIMRYAGLSDKMISLGLYEYNPMLDRAGITAALLAQMVWYFVEGVSLRTYDYPIGTKDNYQRFIVPLDAGQELIFFKSHKSGRWWLEVPHQTSDPKKVRHSLMPCSYEDYIQAAEQEIPERWWKASRKLV